MTSYSVNGTYGRSQTPSTIFVVERSGGKWYTAEGSVNVNFTHDNIENGVDIEELSDDDMFTAGTSINSLEELEEAINE